MKVWIFALLMIVVVACGKDSGQNAPQEEPQFFIDDDGNRIALINGTVATDDEEYLHPVVKIITGSAGCTATVVGKNPGVIVTAAHCVGNGSTSRFTISYGPHKGKSFTAKMTKTKLWGNTVFDIAVGIMDREYPGVPASVHMDRLEVGEVVTLTGYGCTRPGGGGTDGKLRYGDSVVVGRGSYDFVLREPNGAALCYGDSGGPSFSLKGGRLLLSGINSRGNIATTSYLTRLDIQQAKDFFQAWSQANDAKICGYNGSVEDCGEGQDPLPPEKLLLENSILKVEVELKPALKHSVDAVRGLFQMIMDYLEKSEPMTAPPVDLFLTNEEPVTLPGPPL